MPIQSDHTFNATCREGDFKAYERNAADAHHAAGQHVSEHPGHKVDVVEGRVVFEREATL